MIQSAPIGLLKQAITAKFFFNFRQEKCTKFKTSTINITELKRSNQLKNISSKTKECKQASGIDSKKIQSDNKKMRIYTCDKCRMSFENIKLFKKHLAAHEVFFCFTCSKAYQPKKNYNRHMRNVHNKNGSLPRVSCHICKKSLKNKYFLKTHLKIHDPETDYHCPHCKYKNNNLFYMKIHINRHTKQPSYQCELCGENFYEKSILQTHVHVKHGRGFECNICKKAYGTKQRLRDHEKTHDPNYVNVNKYQCEECGQTYTQRAQLKKHILKHKGLDVKYNCAVCGKVLTTKKSFLDHMKIHSGEKSSVCDICGKAFTVEKYLIVHRRIHTGEKPYACLICGKNFTQRVSLVIHNRYHTGERPYKCQVCNRGFVTNTLLTAHSKIHIS